MNVPVFDLHCDTALELLGRGAGQGKQLRKNDLHIDLERSAYLPGYTQCFACFTTPLMEKWMGVAPEIVFRREMEAILTQISANPDRIRQAFSPEDVKNNLENGIFSGILSIEGPAGIGFDPDKLEALYKIGFRMTSLGWNEKNELTGSNVTGGGLTDKGVAYLKEAQRLGMMVDVSHISDEGFWDILRHTEKPIIASHSNSRAVCNHSRNLTDDMFRALCETGGVAGFNQCAPFVGEKPTLDTVCDHILHFLELDPDGKHIALGGDLDGCDEIPVGFTGIESYGAMAQRLLQRGVGEKILGNIYWNNALGVMEICCI